MPDGPQQESEIQMGRKPKKGRKAHKSRSSVMVGPTTELLLLLVLVSKVATLVHQIS